MSQTSLPSLAGPKILLEGPSGSGKTYSLGTLVEWAAAQNPPVPVHVIFTENGLETLLGFWTARNQKVPANLRWHVIRTPALPLTALISGAKDVGRLTYEGLTKTIDPDRNKNNPWEKFLTVLADVPDDRTGTKHGNIGEWSPSSILAVDSLSEAAAACLRMVVGNKPTVAQPEYGVAQTNLLNWLRYMTQAFVGTFVLTGHVDRMQNEITGQVQLRTKAIGKALADEIPQLFSEVLYTYREGTKWHWDTASASFDTKTRYLPLSNKIEPDFGKIMTEWTRRNAAAS